MEVADLRLCAMCGGEFVREYPQKGNRCRPCRAAVERERRKTHPEVHRAAVKNWQANNPGEKKKFQRRYVAKNRSALTERNHANKLRYQHGLTVDEYDAMLTRQQGVCAICGNESPNGQRLAVDHCHKSGQIRGLLCLRCNHALGNMKDRIPVLLSAVEYLKMSQKRLMTQQGSGGPAPAAGR